MSKQIRKMLFTWSENKLLLLEKDTFYDGD